MLSMVCAIAVFMLNICLSVDLILMLRNPFKSKGKQQSLYLVISIITAVALALYLEILV